MYETKTPNIQLTIIAPLPKLTTCTIQPTDHTKITIITTTMTVATLITIIIGVTTTTANMQAILIAIIIVIATKHPNIAAHHLKIDAAYQTQ